MATSMPSSIATCSRPMSASKLRAPAARRAIATSVGMIIEAAISSVGCQRCPR